LSKVQATVISAGNELERVLAARITNPEGISIDQLNKDKRIFKGLKKDKSGKSHDIAVDCVVTKDNKTMLIEIKDGDVFDTKKVAGEIESLNLVKGHLIEQGIPEENIEIRFCSFNAANHAQVEKGAKGLLPEGYAMVGRELCELLELDYEKILEERKEDQGDNFKHFTDKFMEIKEVQEYLNWKEGTSS